MLEIGAGLAVIRLFERDISWNDDHGNAFFGQRGLNRDLQYPWHLLWLGNQLAVVATTFEELVRVRLLEIGAAYFTAGNMCGDSQHRHATALAIIETVDKVHVSRAAASGA